MRGIAAMVCIEGSGRVGITAIENIAGCLREQGEPHVLEKAASATDGSLPGGPHW